MQGRSQDLNLGGASDENIGELANACGQKGDLKSESAILDVMESKLGYISTCETRTAEDKHIPHLLKIVGNIRPLCHC